MNLGDLANVLLGGGIGYTVRLFEERRAELRRMGDRYIENAQANLVLQTDEFWRLGMLQKVGAAELNCLAFAAESSITDYKTRGNERSLLFLKITATLCEGFYVGLLRGVWT
jgi:hypothetical protein